MKTDTTDRLVQNFPVVCRTTLKRTSRACSFVLCLLAVSGPLHPAPPDSQSFQDTPPNPDISQEDTPSWKFETAVSAQVIYDDNIFISHTGTKQDVYAQIAPTFAIGRGDFRDQLTTFAPIPHLLVLTGAEDLPWKNFAYASYTPDAVLFSKYHHEDTVNHDVRLASREETDLWNLNGQLHFQSELAPNIDVGRRIRQRFYTADAGAAYNISGKLTGGAELLAERAEYPGGLNSTDGRIAGDLDYQVAPKTTVGVQVAGGYLDVAHGSNQTYEQSLFQVKYAPGGKMSFVGKAGEEFRQYKSNIGGQTRFVFDASGRYEATDGTLITLSAGRKTTASAEYAGENIVATTYEGGIRQRILARLYVRLSGGFVRNNYESNQPTTVVQRRDDYNYYRAGVSCDVTRHGTLELFYEHRNNDSTIEAFKFDENLAGVSTALLF